MTASDVSAREVVVHGHVQGVFFRAACQQEAARTGVGGWVSNESDGTVRAWLEGPSSSVDAMVGWCSQGPRGAEVERVDVLEREPSGLRRFAVR